MSGISRQPPSRPSPLRRRGRLLAFVTIIALTGAGLVLAGHVHAGVQTDSICHICQQPGTGKLSGPLPAGACVSAATAEAIQLPGAAARPGTTRSCLTPPTRGPPRRFS